MSLHSNLHGIVADVFPLADVVRKIDISDQVLVLELAIGIVGVQLRLVNRLVLLLLFIVLGLSWLDVFRFIAIGSVMCLKRSFDSNCKLQSMNLRLTMNGRNWNFGSNILQLLQLVAKVLIYLF